MPKLQSFQFYPGDWMKDPDLRRCSQAARGVWMDLLCYMFECEERGVLATGGMAWSDKDIARVVSGDQGVTITCIHELLEAGVVSRAKGSGALFSRRMVRDEEIRTKDRERQEKHRKQNSCHGVVTEVVTPLSQGESPPSTSLGSKDLSFEVKDLESKEKSTQISKIGLLVPLDVWAEFVVHRKKLRAPLTQGAIDRILIKLAAFKAAGDDPAMVLGQSIENGWKGIFRIHGERNGSNQKAKPLQGEVSVGLGPVLPEGIKANPKVVERDRLRQEEIARREESERIERQQREAAKRARYR